MGTDTGLSSKKSRSRTIWAIIGTIAAITGGVILNPKPSPKPPPAITMCADPARQLEFRDTCTIILHQELGQTRDPEIGGAMTECLRRANACEDGDTIRAWVHAEPEAILHQNQPPPLPPHPTAHQSGQLKLVGDLSIQDDQGQEWRMAGFTDFSQFRLFLNGVDIQPILTERVQLGANTERVLLSAAALFDLRDTSYTDGQLDDYFDLVAKWEMRIEAVVLADANPKSKFNLVGTFPLLSQQRAFLSRIAGVIARHWNVIGELCNECSHEITQIDRSAFTKPNTPNIWERGSGQADEPPFTPPWDLVGNHAGRQFDWPRRLPCRDIRMNKEPMNSWSQRVRCVENEPMGAAESADPGRRANDPNQFAQFAAQCAMNSNGCTFHSDGGILSAPLGPNQTDAARAFFDALHWVPTNAVLWSYRRGGLSGPQASIIVHTDRYAVDDQKKEVDAGGAMRTFCKDNGAEGWCVAIDPGTKWKATAIDGWQIVEQRRRGLVKLIAIH